MGLLDLKSTVLTVYESDISGQKAGLADLQGEEKKLAEAELEAAEARAQQHKDWLGSLGAITLGLGALAAAGKFVWDGYKEGIKEAQLANTAMGVDLDRLSAAAGGLQTHMELLAFAAKASSSAFGNSQGDMETAERAIRALTARGVDAETAYDAVTNAVVGMKTKGLAALGVFVDTAGVKFGEGGEALGTFDQKLGLHANVMQSLTALTNGVSDSQDNLGDSMTRAEVDLSDAWAKLKTGLGELVVAMAPLLEALASAVGLIAEAAKGQGHSGWGLDALTGGAGSILRSEDNARKQIAQYKAQDDAAQRGHAMWGDPADAANDPADAANGSGPNGALGNSLTKLQDGVAKVIGRATDKINNALPEITFEDNTSNMEEQARKRVEDAKKAGEKWAEQHKKMLAEINEIAKKATDDLVKELDKDIDQDPDGYVERASLLARLRGDPRTRFGGTDTPSTVTIDQGGPTYGAGRDGTTYGSPTFDSNGMNSTGAAGWNASNWRTTQGTGGLGVAAQNFDQAVPQQNWWDVSRPGAQDALAQQKLADATAGKTLLEKTFGKPGEFDLYKKAFEGLTKAATAAFDAWITGSESAGDAFKKAVGQIIEALANQMLVESLKYTAMGIGSIFLNPAETATDFAAAAAYAAGAVAAGALAKDMGSAWGVGASSSSSSGSGSGASGVPTSPAGSTTTVGSAAGNTNGNAVIVVGDQWSSSTARMKQIAAKKYVDLALGQLGYGVSNR